MNQQTDPIRTRSRSQTTPARSITLADPVSARVTHEGTIHVHRAAYGREEEHTETIRVPNFAGPVARVRVEGSVTRNLGDYNSARVAVAIEMPCYPEMGEVQRVYELLSAKLDELVPQELAKALPVDGEGA